MTDKIVAINDRKELIDGLEEAGYVPDDFSLYKISFYVWESNEDLAGSYGTYVVDEGNKGQSNSSKPQATIRVKEMTGSRPYKSNGQNGLL